MWPIVETLTGTITLGQSEPGSNGNEGILHILQSLNFIIFTNNLCFRYNFSGDSLKVLERLDRETREASTFGKHILCNIFLKKLHNLIKNSNIVKRKKNSRLNWMVRNGKKTNLREYFLQLLDEFNKEWSSYRHCINGLVGRVFANGPGNRGSIPGRVIPKTLKMVLNTSLLNTQQYKVRIKVKVEKSREKSSALPYTSV